MKKVIFTFIAVLGVAMFQNATAQDVQTIKLEQTTGEFDKKELTLTAGMTYQFEVTNKGVDHEVGFVLAPSNNTGMDGHIKEAYLKNTVMDGKTAKSGEVTLEAGEYVFFCPMNPTPQYKVAVKDGMDKKAMMAKDEMAKEKMAKEKMVKDEMAKKEMAKEKMAKEKMSKEKMAKDEMAKEKMSKEKMAKEKMAKDEMVKKEMTDSNKKVKTIKLTQTDGEFNKTKLKLKAGKTYQFEVTNSGVDHEVGFVLAPATNTNMDGHIKDAYLKNTVMDGKTAKSGEVTLEAGEYVFFCPMNPTPQYTVVVK